MRPVYAARRVDTASKLLVKAARQLGVDVEPSGGAVDAFLWLGSVVRLVDWKSPGKADLTPSQAKLIARGCPLHFVSTVEQLQALIAGMKREAGR
jgi:hypothetical protein